MIKGVKNARGFTILEVMIVLAVTAALFISAFALISGQQQKTQFSQSINDLKSQVDQIISNVSTGYYSSNDDFNCTVTGGNYTIHSIPPGTDSRGTNTDCIYIGRVVQFAVHGTNGSGFNAYNLIGRQYVSGTILSTSLTDAQPIALTYSGSQPASITMDTTINTTEQHNLLYGLKVSKMYYNGNPANQVGAFALISSLSHYTGGNLDPGAQQVSLYAVNGNTTADGLNETPDDMIGQQIDSLTHLNNPVNSVDVCIDGGGTGQHADLFIGSLSANSQLGTTLKVDSGPC